MVSRSRRDLILTKMLNILYDDAFVTVCEKPVGVSSEAMANEDSMLSFLSDYYREKGEDKTPY